MLSLIIMIRTVLLLAATTTTAISASPHSPPVLERQWRLRLGNPIAALADSKTRFGTVAADVLAGSGAALVAYSIATPLETVKTVNQMNGGRTRDTLKAVVERGGKRSLVDIRSLRAMWTAGVPYSMLLYSVYRPLKAASRDFVERVRGPERVRERDLFAADMVAAAGAEILGLFAFIPGELVAKRMMVDPTRYSGVSAALKSIVAERGILGAFTGFGACLVRDVPYTMLQFAIFDAVASAVLAPRPGSTLRFDQSLAIGASAAVVASTVTLPIDAIKSQMMLAAESVSIPALVTDVVRTQGPGALFRGLPTYMTINIAKWSSSQAVYNKLRGAD